MSDTPIPGQTPRADTLWSIPHPPPPPYQTPLPVDRMNDMPVKTLHRPCSGDTFQRDSYLPWQWASHGCVCLDTPPSPVYTTPPPYQTTVPVDRMNDMPVKTLPSLLHYATRSVNITFPTTRLVTRMHSSRMRTSGCSSSEGGVSHTLHPITTPVTHTLLSYTPCHPHGHEDIKITDLPGLVKRPGSLAL